MILKQYNFFPDMRGTAISWGDSAEAYAGPSQFQAGPTAPGPTGRLPAKSH